MHTCIGFIIFMLFFVSCNSSTTMENTLRNNEMITPTIVQITNSQKVITITPSAVNTVLPIALSTPTLEKVQQPSCITAASDVPATDELSGQIVFRGRKQVAFLWNPQTGNKTSLEDKFGDGYITRFSSSPNGQWLAYVIEKQTPPHLLMVVSADGKTQNQLVWNESQWFALTGWLSNEAIVFVNQRLPFYSTVVVNPFTGIQNEYSLAEQEQYPEILGASSFYFATSNIVPDPSMEYLVFPQMVEGKYYIALSNQETNQVVVRLEDQYAFGHDPLWAEDSRNFMIVGAVQSQKGSNEYPYNLVDEWFRVTQEGRVQEVTSFRDQFQSSTIAQESRSPDGNSLAFAFKDNDSTNQEWEFHWVSLDKESNIIQQGCVYGEGRRWLSPVWSPDSHYVIIANQIDEIGPVILIDTVLGWAAKVTEDVLPMGWLVNP